MTIIIKIEYVIYVRQSSRQIYTFILYIYLLNINPINIKLVIF